MEAGLNPRTGMGCQGARGAGDPACRHRGTLRGTDQAGPPTTASPGSQAPTPWPPSPPGHSAPPRTLSLGNSPGYTARWFLGTLTLTLPGWPDTLSCLPSITRIWRLPGWLITWRN